MAGHLTTHVLDITQGRPAAGMVVELWRLDAARETRTPLRTARTNADGRTAAPMLADAEMAVGVYELVFAVGDYFRAQGMAAPEPAFLDRVPVRFGIADPTAHYHVPLLTSPWAYSTYRGS
ncbi:MAG TPA: hydroxyisourate hydrolase [Ktedonobacterales bacterium]|jgi:5-hydroxyisourate hydrolase|nr:hydroxyisourate hydrolase [Ktedonobacterales bacterium]